jgi:hypothetical protein
MNISRWNKKRLGLLAIVVVTFYLTLSARTSTYQVDTVIYDISPEDVWEYVADFSKMKLLNPLM